MDTPDKSIFVEINESGVVQVCGELENADLALRLTSVIQGLDLAVQEVFDHTKQAAG